MTLLERSISKALCFIVGMLLLLNVYITKFVLSAKLKFMLYFCLFEAKRCIARWWKEHKICGLSQWTDLNSTF